MTCASNRPSRIDNGAETTKKEYIPGWRIHHEAWIWVYNEGSI